ncbi:MULTISPECIES: hypothetical protein [unclassified Streptomyces]|uniref:hypothetical protein n=1 Tax=Streptomyces TaxID=1883 RepID=UPI001F2DF907|nr:hypothetical protein [Streptomyces sp. 9-7]
MAHSRPWAGPGGSGSAGPRTGQIGGHHVRHRAQPVRHLRRAEHARQRPARHHDRLGDRRRRAQPPVGEAHPVHRQ